MVGVVCCVDVYVVYLDVYVVGVELCVGGVDCGEYVFLVWIVVEDCGFE